MLKEIRDWDRIFLHGKPYEGDAVVGILFITDETTDEISGNTSDAAIATTLTTGGLSSEVTIPLAKGADVTQAVSKFIKGTILMDKGHTGEGVGEFIDGSATLFFGNLSKKGTKALRKSGVITSKSSENIIEATLSSWYSAAKTFFSGDKK